MFKSCLICTDFTDSLQRLVDFIPSLGKSGLQEIVFFHNVSLWEEGEIPRIDQEKVDQAIALLQKAQREVPAGMEVKIEVTSGRVIDNLTKTLQKYNSEVVIVGTPIKSVIEEKMFGSTTIALTKVISVPMMILRPQLICTYTVEELSLRCEHLWRYLLIPYNDEANDRYLIDKVKDYASQGSSDSGKKALLLSVIDDGARRGIPVEYRVKEAEEKIAQVKSDLESSGVEVVAEVREGNVLHEVLSAAMVYDISCVAIASNVGNFLESVAPSLASEILHKSWFPVLFFPIKK